jgi:hypothetical protein
VGIAAENPKISCPKLMALKMNKFLTDRAREASRIRLNVAGN